MKITPIISEKIRFILFVLIFSFLLMNISFAEDQNRFIEKSKIDLKFKCSIDGSPCSAGSTGNIIVFYPNSTDIFINSSLSLLIPDQAIFNYTITNSSLIGKYSGSVLFSDPVKNKNFTSMFNFEIVSGFELETSNKSVFGIIMIILIFIMMMVCIIVGFHFKSWEFIVAGSLLSLVECITWFSIAGYVAFIFLMISIALFFINIKFRS